MTVDPTTPVATPMISDSTLEVVAYRLGQLEATVGRMDTKLDHQANVFVSHQTLELIVAPIRGDLVELQGKDREREKERNANLSQLKLAIMVCIASPVASIIISVILGNNNNG